MRGRARQREAARRSTLPSRTVDSAARPRSAPSSSCMRRPTATSPNATRRCCGQTSPRSSSACGGRGSCRTRAALAGSRSRPCTTRRSCGCAAPASRACLPTRRRGIGVEYRVHRRGAAGDEILVRIEGSPRRVQDLADALRRDARVQVELMLPIEHGERVLGLTPDLVARFAAHVRRADIEQRAARHGLTVVRPMPHAGNAFMLRGAPLDYGILAAADALAASPRVVYVEPNLVVRSSPMRSRRTIRCVPDAASHADPRRRGVGSPRRRQAGAARRIARHHDCRHRPERRGTRITRISRRR